MILTVNEVKEFLKLENDYTEEDNMLTSLIIASENYIKNATGKTFSNDDELYKLAVKILLSHWYDNRNAVNIGSISKSLEYSLSSILSQLTYCDEV